MKRNAKKSSVKVDAKNVIIGNHKEFIRIKRKVIKKVIRKPNDLELDKPQKKKKFSIVKNMLTYIFWKKDEEVKTDSTQPNFNTNDLETHNFQENNHFVQEEEVQVILSVSDEESEAKVSNLFMPLQF
jgi:hypothetical protein